MADVATPGVGWHRAYLALGSNLLQPQQQVLRTILALQQIPGIAVVAVSSLYQSAAWGAVSAQPDYINAVAELRTALAPHPLLQRLQDIEQAFGRVRSVRNAPRTLDLDLLLYGDRVLHDDTLTLPHPRLHLRAFVLQPLAEIDPRLVLPGHGGLAPWLARAADQGIERIGAA